MATMAAPDDDISMMLKGMSVKGGGVTEEEMTSLTNALCMKLNLPREQCHPLACNLVRNNLTDSNNLSAQTWSTESDSSVPQRSRGRSPARDVGHTSNMRGKRSLTPLRGLFKSSNNGYSSVDNHHQQQQQQNPHVPQNKNSFNFFPNANANPKRPQEEKKEVDIETTRQQIDKMGLVEPAPRFPTAEFISNGGASHPTVHTGIRGRSPSPGPDVGSAQPKIPGSPHHRPGLEENSNTKAPQSPPSLRARSPTPNRLGRRPGAENEKGAESPGAPRSFSRSPSRERDQATFSVQSSIHMPDFDPNSTPGGFIPGRAGPKPKHRNKERRTGGTPFSSQPAHTYRGPDRVLSPMDVEMTDAATPPPPQAEMSPGNFVVGRGPGGNRRSFRRPMRSKNTRSYVAPPPQPEPEDPQEYTGFAALVNSKRDEARQLYTQGEYQATIVAYTQAIQAFNGIPPTTQTQNMLALLKSNRAAALLMIGAYAAAAEDCQKAIPLVSRAESSSDPFSNDGGPPLRIKLKMRYARAILRLGNDRQARTSLEEALFWASDAIKFSSVAHSPTQATQVKSTIDQMITEANVALVECTRVTECRDKIAKNLNGTRNGRPDENKFLGEALVNVGMALATASGCIEFQLLKVTLLTRQKKWREAAGYCERLAAQNVAMDHAFGADLGHPFGAPPAVYLTVDYFQGTRESDLAAVDLKLNSKCAAEAVLRMPLDLTQLYVRALRLEERYPAADAVLKSLEEWIRRDSSVARKLTWLPDERSFLDRTKIGRERGDELFRNGDYDQAAAQYLACLVVDGENKEENAGGRLHAVLHCNRAACLMALRQYSGALLECAAALKIHPRYMKAMLRRARCLNRLQRYAESISVYTKYLSLVDDFRKGNTTGYVTPCVFDGPSEVKDKDLETVRGELENAHVAKRKVEATVREDSNRRQQRQRWQQNFANSGSTAQQRREEFYNQSGDSGARRWDSFSNRRPHHRSDSWNGSQHSSRSTGGASAGGAKAGGAKAGGANRSSHRRSESLGSPGSDLTTSHYKVLGVERSASQEEVKKAYRKMALKFHPDKNQEEGASDTFRRVQLAYDTLGDVTERRNYDASYSFGGSYY